MKRGTPDHPKARALAASLQLERWQVVGLLESVFNFAALYARRGDIGRHTDQEIANHIGWRADATRMVEALVAARWLDRCACHRLRVHDWPEHTDQTVRRTEEVKNLGFLACYGLPPQVDAPPLLADKASFLCLAEKASQPSPSPSPTPTNTPPTPLRGEPAVETSAPTSIDTGDVLTLTEQLAAEFIAVGGRADRAWRRAVKHELKARGLEEGARAVRAQVEERRVAAAAESDRARRSAFVRQLVDQARESGRDGRREWAAVLAQLEAVMDSHLFHNWFRCLQVVGVLSDDEGDRVLVAAPSEQIATWVQSNYQQRIAAATTAAGLELSVLVVELPPAAMAG